MIKNQDSPASFGANSTASSGPDECQDPLASLKIKGVPAFELGKVEFLEKLGEGKKYTLNFLLKNVNTCFRSFLGAFGKVRLAKVLNGGGLTDLTDSYNSPSKRPAQAAEFVSPLKSEITSPEKERAENTVELVAIKILSK